MTEAYWNVLFADEHCWGGTRPAGHAQDLCWNEKRAYFYEAALAAERALVLPVQAVSVADDGPHLVVFNPLSWECGGIVRRTLGETFPHEKRCRALFDPDQRFELIDVTTGRSIPHQLTPLSYFDDARVGRPRGPTHELVFFAESLPAEGFTTYRIAPRRRLLLDRRAVLQHARHRAG